MTFVIQKGISGAINPETGTVVDSGGGMVSDDAGHMYRYECKDMEGTFRVYFELGYRFGRQSNGENARTLAEIAAYVLEPNLRFEFCLGFKETADLTDEETQACRVVRKTYLAWSKVSSKHPELAFDDPGLPPRLEARYAEFRAEIREGLWVYITQRRNAGILELAPDFRVIFVRRECELPSHSAKSNDDQAKGR